MFKRALPACLALLLVALPAACSTKSTIKDPLAELASIEVGPNRHIAAMEMLDSSPADDEAYLASLRRMIHQPGYTPQAREEAFNRLAERDPVGLKQTIELRLPSLSALEWRRRLCELVAQRGWTDLSPTLARAWAKPIAGWVDSEEQRPEYLALAAMHGPDRVVDVVFEIFRESSSPAQSHLRARCWELLHRLGYRDRLMELVRRSEIAPDDALLIDLRAGLDDLGILPANMEEILWLRKLRQPEHAAFWSEAVAASGHLPVERKAELELRTLPVVVAAWRHEPELLTASTTALYDRVSVLVKSARKHSHTVSFEGYSGEYGQTLYEQRKILTWGDLAAILLAVRALAVPELRGHLFDFADRDLEDRSTEYGGILRLDSHGRFELIEYLPRVRMHDNRFDAPQELIDAGYTALFHFHLHAQKHDNDQYAGPHMGDLNYAQNVRANCLVFTFVSRDALNADFYRHHNVIVDMGEIARP